MKLRQLLEKDVPFMLEWMKDGQVNQFFRFNPDDVTEDSIKCFIRKSAEEKNTYHFAIADCHDEYLGTVSLKHVDEEARNAEYAISLRSYAQGKGVGKFATESILEFAFCHLNLERIYLNVLSDNIRAIAFYRKIGFIYEGEFCRHIYVQGSLKNIKWYRMMRCEYFDR
jgi:RimJ/RimL family protein N-acetyltransferase